jgi:hypothetical protein
VRWRGHTSVDSDDEWLRAEDFKLAHCQERVAEYDAAAPRRRRTRRNTDAPAVPAGARVAVAAPLPVAQAGFRLAPAAGEVLTGAALVGRSILYRSAAQGWVLGKVARRVSRAAGFSSALAAPAFNLKFPPAALRLGYAQALTVARRPWALGRRQPRCWTPRCTALGMLAGGCFSARPSFGFNGTTVMGRRGAAAGP